jgi:thiol-disulfide isomerase/thioredoxin
MKLKLVLMLALLATVAASAQTTMRLSGKVTNYGQNFFILGYHQFRDTIPMGQDGTFALEFKDGKTDFYSLQFGKQKVTCYLLAGDTASIVYDARMPIENMKFAGANQPYNAYLQQRAQNNKGNWSSNNGFSATLPQTTMVQRRDSITNLRNSLLDQFSKQHKFDKRFVEACKKSNEYLRVSELIGYENSIQRMGPADVSVLRKGWRITNWSDSTMLWMDDYKSFLENVITVSAADAYYANPNRTFMYYCEQQIQIACEKIPNQEVRNMVLPGLMDGMFEQLGMQDTRGLVTKFKACCTDKYSVDRITYRSLMYQHLFPGNPSPYFACYDSTGKKYTLADFKGKVVYVDVWATWCGPCKREIPDLQKLEEEYHGKNVAFVSISTDRDEKAWRDFLKKQTMGGYQLHQSQNFDETISKAFVINGIPRFILFDEEGKIVNPEAPRPSSGAEIRQLLDKTLE